MDVKLQQEIAKHFEERGLRFPTILLPIIDRVVCAVPLVATERAEDYLDLLRTAKATVVLDFNVNQRFSAQPATGRVFLGVDGLERSWAYCHLFVGAFALFLEDSPYAIDAPRGNDLTKLMLRSLDWAFENDVNKRGLVYPDDLPKPREKPENGSFFEHFHFNTYVAAVAWITLHEIGHVVLGHTTDGSITAAESQDEELEADAWAADWLLAKAPTADAYLQRTRAIVVGVALAAYLEIWVSHEGDPDHPRYPERLVAMLDRIGIGIRNDKVRKALWMAGAMLVFQRAALAKKEHLFTRYNFYRRPRLFIRRAMAAYPTG